MALTIVNTITDSSTPGTLEQIQLAFPIAQKGDRFILAVAYTTSSALTLTAPVSGYTPLTTGALSAKLWIEVLDDPTGSTYAGQTYIFTPSVADTLSGVLIQVRGANLYGYTLTGLTNALAANSSGTGSFTSDQVVADGQLWSIIAARTTAVDVDVPAGSAVAYQTVDPGQILGLYRQDFRAARAITNGYVSTDDAATEWAVASLLMYAPATTAAPVNDAVANALTLALNTPVTFDLLNASQASGEPAHWSAGPFPNQPRTIWYKFVPAATGRYRIAANTTPDVKRAGLVLRAADADTEIAYSSVDADGSLDVTAVDYASVVYATLTTATTYYVQVVDRRPTIPGDSTGQLQITAMPALAGDAFATAPTITGTAGNTTVSTAGASEETGEPVGRNAQATTLSVWRKIIPSGSARYRFWVTPNSGTTIETWDASIDVWTGSSVAALSLVTDPSDGDAQGNAADGAILNATSGTTYYVRVYGSDPSDGFDNAQLNWALAPRPANSVRAGALVLNPATAVYLSPTASQITVPYDNTSAYDAAATIHDRALYYSITPTRSGTITVDLSDTVDEHLIATIDDGVPATGSVIEVDEPDDTNTGIEVGTVLTPYTGSLTITTAGTTIANLDISGTVNIRAANVTVTNCKIRGLSTYTTTKGIVDCTNAACVNATITHCEIYADNPSYYAHGIQGHDYTATFNNLHDVVDGFGIFDPTTPSAALNVVIEQNYVHALSWFSPDPNHSNNETHNDCIEFQGGTGPVRIRGNTLRAEYSATTGNSPRPDRGTGTTADGRYNWGDLCCVMVADLPNDTYPLSTEPSGKIEILGNWMYGAKIAINATPATGDLGYILRNRFDRAQGSQGSGGDNTHTVDLNTILYCETGVGGANQNYYMSNGNPVTVRGGISILARTGSFTLTGGGTPTATAKVAHTASFTLAGGGTPTASGSASTPVYGTFTLTGGGTPTATGLAAHLATYTLSGGGALTLTGGQPPTAPTLLTALTRASAVDLTWSALTTQGITDYLIQYRTTVGPGSWNTFADGTSTAKQTTVTGLTSGISYDFRVAAVNAAGTSSYSATATVAAGRALAVDTFTRADTATGLGTTSDGRFTYAGTAAAFQISTNAMAGISTAGNNFLTFNALAADFTLQATATGSPASSETHLVFRWASSANFLRVYSGASSGSAGKWALAVTSTGSTTYPLVTTKTATAGDVITVVTTSFTINLYVNGVYLGQVTSTTGFTSTTFGFYQSSGAVSGFDDLAIYSPTAGVAALSGGGNLFGGSITATRTGARLVDTFDRTDTTTGLGTTSDGLYTYSGTTAAFRILSNQMQGISTSGTTNIITANAGVANVTVQATAKGTPSGSDTALVFRWASSSTYWMIYSGSAASVAGKWALARFASSAFTYPLVSASTAAANDVVKVVLTSTTVQFFVNGVSQGTVTDSTGNSGQRVGFWQSNGGVSAFDDLSVT